MLWLALHLPSLSLEAFCATLPGRADDDAASTAAAPVALVAEHRITACNAAAAECGVRAGQKRATALALAPQLLMGEADAARDAAALRAVAHVALAFTPSVTLADGAATVLMEVRASLRLFGGLPALHRRLREALAPLAHRVQIAAAPTAVGAAVLARWRGSEGDLAAPAKSLPALERLLLPAPLWLLGPGREHWEALQGMGLKTLADLRELPRAGLARRFGEGLLLELDRAFGRASDPRRWLELPERFESRLELHQRADRAEQVLAAASVLLARLVAWAEARQGRIAAFTLVMQHEPRHAGRGGGSVPATELRIELAAPALEAAHLQLLLRERLAHVVLAAPTLELRLRCRDLTHGAPPNGELFPTRSSEALGLARLLERLRARLGDEQVQRLEPVADHRPERGSRGVAAMAAGSGQVAAGSGQVAASAQAALPARAAPTLARASVAPPRSRRAAALVAPAGSASASSMPLNRPAWLLPEPVPLPERHGLPWLDGQPLQLVSGPERIEAGWWDGAPAARDYFIALAADGSLVWVWRARLPVPASGHGAADVQWMMQGRFG